MMDTKTDTRLRYWQRSFAGESCGDLIHAVGTKDATRLILADACGHGPEAAAIAGIFLRICQDDLAHAMEGGCFRKWNRSLEAMFPAGRFVAVTIVELSHAGDVARIWNAGNPAPVHVSGRAPVARCINRFGMPLGALPPDEYEPPRCHAVRLSAEDRLLVFSDGLIDQCDALATPGATQITEIAAGAALRGDDPLQRLRSIAELSLRRIGPVDDMTVIQVHAAERPCDADIPRVDRAA